MRRAHGPRSQPASGAVRARPWRATLAAAVALLALGGGTARADGAHITAERRLDARVIELTIATPAFPEPTHVQVDLPVGYDADPARRWPVTYYLAGTGHRYTDFNAQYDGERLTAGFPSIVVAPDGRSGYWSDWFNGGRGGPPAYETFVIDELIPLIDARFRTTAARSGRAIMGESMGGYGAMMDAARHPDLFAAAASLSGAVDSNLPANGAVLSASSALDGSAPDAIYGPRASEEIRWRGHNPTDLAANLRSLTLRISAANGLPAPGIGEGPAELPGCAVEVAVHMASVDLRDALDRLHVPNTWRDYGAGCHSVPNFERQIADTLPVFTRVFADPPPLPATFDHLAIDPHIDVWGWHVDADPARALEFLRLRDAGPGGVTLDGSGLTRVTTAPLFPGARVVDLAGAGTPSATPDAAGRITFTVDLGAPDRQQQDTPGAVTRVRTRAVTFAPRARVRITSVRVTGRTVRVCARAVAGTVRARIRLTPSAGTAHVTLGAATTCRTLRRARPAGRHHVTVSVAGRDAFGHPAAARRTVASR